MWFKMADSFCESMQSKLERPALMKLALDYARKYATELQENLDKQKYRQICVGTADSITAVAQEEIARDLLADEKTHEQGWKSYISAAQGICVRYNLCEIY